MPQHKNPCPGIMKFIVLVQSLVRTGQVVLEMLKHEALRHDEQKTDAKRFYSSQSIFTISLSYPFEQNTKVQEKKICLCCQSTISIYAPSEEDVAKLHPLYPGLP